MDTDKGCLTAPVGATDEIWLYEQRGIRMAHVHTTDKHILISFHRNGLDDALYTIQRSITLFQGDGRFSW